MKRHFWLLFLILLLGGMILSLLLAQVVYADHVKVGAALTDPTIDKAFSPGTIVAGGTSTLTFTLTNSNLGTGLTGLNFTDSYPSGVVNATPLTVGGSCGGITHTAAAGGGTFNLTAATIGVNTTCTVTVVVTATTAGAKVNTTGNLGSTETGSGSDNATDTLTVNNPTLTINVVSSFGADNIDSTTGTPSPGPINCPGGGVCAATFLSNESVTLNVTVDAASSFQGWSGDCAAFGAALSGAITMDGDKTCTATFAQPLGIGDTTYVSDQGSDSNDCATPETACATIQRGINEVSPAGEVHVTGCEFSGGITISKSLSLIHEPEPGERSCGIIDANGGPGITIGASNVTVRGFTFKDFGAGSSAGVVVNSGNNVVITDNNFIDSPSDAGVHRNGGTVTAENNWWGCSAGPNTTNCTNATGGVDRDPWTTVPPGLGSIVRHDPKEMVTSAEALVFRTSFDQCVNNVSTGDFVVNGGSTAVVSKVDLVDADCPCVYDVTVSGVGLKYHNGDVGLDLSSSQDITDLRGNLIPTVEPQVDEVYRHRFACEIGPDGGACCFDENVFVLVPPGVASSQANACYVAIRQVSEDNLDFGFENEERVFDIYLECDGQTMNGFSQLVTACLSPEDGMVENKLIYHNHDGNWGALDVVKVAGENYCGPGGKVCGAVSDFSLFTLGDVFLPATGFPVGASHALPTQPLDAAYENIASAGGMILEIPQLGVEMEIVGVPLNIGGWDTTWLGNRAGYLEGSAFPTWAGNTIITGHVWDADNQPGPFLNLNSLQHGDRFYIHTWGQKFTYQVQSSNLVYPNDLSVLRPSDYDMVTLLTCENWSDQKGEYRYRRAIQAILVSVETE